MQPNTLDNPNLDKSGEPQSYNNNNQVDSNPSVNNSNSNNNNSNSNLNGFCNNHFAKILHHQLNSSNNIICNL